MGMTIFSHEDHFLLEFLLPNQVVEANFRCGGRLIEPGRRGSALEDHESITKARNQESIRQQDRDVIHSVIK